MNQNQVKPLKHQQVLSWMATAYMQAGLSKAQRGLVGALLLRPLEDGTHQVLASGYNGTAPGEDNACEDQHGLTLPSVRHAERNVLTKVSRSTLSTQQTIMFVTKQPCYDCACWMADCGVSLVYYSEPYKCHKGTEELERRGVEVLKVEPSEVQDYILSIGNLTRMPLRQHQHFLKASVVEEPVASSQVMPPELLLKYLTVFSPEAHCIKVVDYSGSNVLAAIKLDARPIFEFPSTQVVTVVQTLQDAKALPMPVVGHPVPTHVYLDLYDSQVCRKDDGWCAGNDGSFTHHLAAWLLNMALATIESEVIHGKYCEYQVESGGHQITFIFDPKDMRLQMEQVVDHIPMGSRTHHVPTNNWVLNWQGIRFTVARL